MPQKQPRLSVCMTVQNEESQLSRALDSVKSIADEIVVVDTGSQDRSIEIARSYGAKVYEHPWQDDAALHCNQAVEHAEGEWIFVLGADEEFQGGHETLFSALENTDKDAVALPVFSVSAQEGRPFESLQNSVRLLRASAKIRFSDAVASNADFDGRYHFVNAPVLRHRFDRDIDSLRARFMHDTEKLLELHRIDQQNPAYPYQLSLCYLSLEMFGETIISADRAIELAEKLKSPERVRWIAAYYARAAAAVAMKDMPSAEYFSSKALMLLPDYIDAHYVASLVYYTQKDSLLLRDSSEKYLALHNEFTNDFGAVGLTPLFTLKQKTSVLLRLAVDAWRNGQAEEASDWYRKALESSSDFSDAVLSIREALWGEGMYSQALHVLEVAVERSNYERRLMDALVETFARMHRSSDAAAAIQRMENSGHSGSAVFELRARLAMLSGDFKSARDLYRMVAESEPQNVSVRVRLGLASEGLGENAMAERMFVEAAELAEDSTDAAVHLSRLYCRMERWDEALARLEPAMQKSARRFDGLLMLLRIYINLGLVDKLMDQVFRLTLMLNVPLKSDTIDSTAELADILSELAKRLENSDHILAAEEAHSLAIQLAPEIIKHHLEFARFLVRFGRMRDGVNLLENLIRRHPDNRETFVVMAECYEAMGAHDAAAMARKRADDLLNMN